MKRLTKRVLLIGWDAADWNMIRPLMEEGKMPVMKQLVEFGVSGNVATLAPVLSPILWNSIATGKYAYKHGILGFIEPNPDGKGARPVRSTTRTAKALWNILGQCGLRSGVVNWYASHPAEPIEGSVFTNVFPYMLGPKAERIPLDPRAVHPPELFEFAQRFQVNPATLTPMQVMPFFPKRPPNLSSEKDLRGAIMGKLLAECVTTHNAATYLASRDDWDFLAVYYETIDLACHNFMEYHPPAMAHVSADDAEIFGGVVQAFYEFHDMMLGRLLDVAGPETTVILLSDHGFYNNHLRPPVAEHSLDPKEKFGPKMNPVSWHRRQGIFVAAGKPIKRDELTHGTSLLDVAPTILALLGLPVPDDMDGRVLTRIFKEPIEIERIDSYEAPHPKDGMHRGVAAEESDPYAARQALEQLAALGYIELADANDPEKEAAIAVRERDSNLAQVYFAANKPAEALAILNRMLAEKDEPGLKIRVALCLLALGRAAEAEPIMREIMEKHPNLPGARLILGRTFMAQQKLDEAFAMLEPLQNEESNVPIFQAALGLIYLRRGLLTEAETAFRRAIEVDDDSVEAHDGLGIALRRQGRYEDSIYEHMRAATLQHLRPQTHLNLGIALANSGQFDWAIRAFSLASEMAPNEPLPHRWLAMIYRRAKKDMEKAREHRHKFVELARRRKELREAAAPNAGSG
jgi:tetratricopeptide (TPR) repeat protein